MNTYPEMNEKIVGILKVSDEPHHLYAAQLIEELQARLNEQQPVPQQVGGYSESQMYDCALQFFYYWGNAKGNNTAQGLQEWLPTFIASLPSPPLNK
mgnify:CR=1 FL=1